MLSRRQLLIGLVAALLLGAVGAFWFANRPVPQPTETPTIVVNEAARTLVYLPLYHAQRAGYFEREGVHVEIVTGGSATNAVAALIAGEADIAQADPMYAPISQQNGSDIVVIGQIVGRIGLWAVRRPGSSLAFDRAGLRNAPIITHPQPMTAYTYTTLYLREFGIEPTNVIQARPGTEVATYVAETRAPFLIGVEPTISILESQGAVVVHSWPEAVGDRVFSGLMTRRSLIQSKRDALERVLRAYQSALDDIASNSPEVMVTAHEYFPDMDQAALTRALERLRTERVFPQSLRISQTSWESAVGARRAAGDITGPADYAANVEDAFTAAALR